MASVSSRTALVVLLSLPIGAIGCGRSQFESSPASTPGGGLNAGTPPFGGAGGHGGGTGSGTPGSLDTAFGTNGRVEISHANAGARHATLAGTRLVIAGSTAGGDGSRATLIAIDATTGAPDGSFGSGGASDVRFGSGDSTGNAVAWVGSTLWIGGGSTDSGKDHAVIARIDAAGALVPGSTIDLNGALKSSEVVALASDGASLWIAAAGADGNGSDVSIVEHRASDGSLLAAFASGGRLTLTDVALADVAVAPGGGVVAGGSANNVDVYVAKLDATGAPATSAWPFTWSASGSSRSATLEGLSVAADGSVLVAGSYDDGNQKDALIAKLSEAAAFDPAFADGAPAILDLGSGSDHATRAFLLDDGSVLAGATGDEMGALRLDAAGNPITGFGVDGWIAVPRPSSSDKDSTSDAVRDPATGVLFPIGTDGDEATGFIAGRIVP